MSYHVFSPHQECSQPSWQSQSRVFHQRAWGLGGCETIHLCPCSCICWSRKKQIQVTLVTKGKLESEFKIVSCELLRDAVAVVPIIKERDMKSDKSNYVYDDHFFVVRNRNAWAGFFHQQIRSSEPKQQQQEEEIVVD